MLWKRKVHVFELFINFKDDPTLRVILLSITSKESDIELLFEQFLMIFPEHRHFIGVSVSKLLKVRDALVIFTVDFLAKIFYLILKSFPLPSQVFSFEANTHSASPASARL
ncbi:hypothetical protein C1H46_023589 [Malus baccata]|uniref:Uncharacterized protein n=1 Tax=Malus baccata TaxID=106549 RepID=A0A540LWV5_MALBA|nr:hypothetical protein C1H46_023589 [Malus baccata]